MKKLVMIIALFSLAGCAATKNMALDRELLPALNEKSATLIKHESPSFVAMTSGKGMFALVGVGAAVEAGNKLVKESQIQDPALQIGKLVGQDLDGRFGLIISGQSDSVAEKYDIANAVKLAQNTDYVIDVVTTGWSFMYDGFKFSDYFVAYSGKFRLIDVASSKTIAECACIYNTKSAGKLCVSYETLIENDAAYIKHALQDATDFCAEKIKKELF